MIDKTNHGQVGFAHVELLKCLTHPDLEGVPIVVVFNKELRTSLLVSVSVPVSVCDFQH